MSDDSGVDNTSDDPLAKRLAATFAAEAETLADRHAAQATGPTEPVELVPELAVTPSSSPWWQRSIVPLAAALVLVVAVGAVLAVSNRNQNATPTEADLASQVDTPQSTALAATPEPEPPSMQPTQPAPPSPESTATPVPEPQALAPDVAPDLPPTPMDPPPATTPNPSVPTPFDPMCVTGIVAPDTLNVRSGPSLDDQVIAELQPGQCGLLRVGELVDGWVPVDLVFDRQGTRLTGWVSARFTGPDTFGPVTPPVAEPVRPPYEPGLFQKSMCVTGIIAPDVLNLRSGPGVENLIVRELPPDQCGIYVSGDRVQGWLPVVVSFGSDGDVSGWVSERYVRVPGPEINPAEPATVITIRMEYTFDDPSSIPEPSSFEVIGPDSDVIAYLDDNFMAAVPDSFDPVTLWVQAPFPDDPYCGWTGPVRYDAPGDRYRVELAALCA